MKKIYLIIVSITLTLCANAQSNINTTLIDSVSGGCTLCDVVGAISGGGGDTIHNFALETTQQLVKTAAQTTATNSATIATNTTGINLEATQQSVLTQAVIIGERYGLTQQGGAEFDLNINPVPTCDAIYFFPTTLSYSAIRSFTCEVQIDNPLATYTITFYYDNPDQTVLGTMDQTEPVKSFNGFIIGTLNYCVTACSDPTAVINVGLVISGMDLSLPSAGTDVSGLATQATLASVLTATNTTATNTGTIAASTTSIDGKLTTSNTNTGNTATSTATTATNTGTIAASTTSIDSKLTTSNTNTGNTATSTATTATNTGNTATSVSSIDTKMSTSNTNTGNIATNTSNTATSVSSIDTKMSTSNTNTGNIATSTASSATSDATTATQTTNTATSAASIDTKMSTSNTNTGNIATSTATTATQTTTTATNTGTIATNTGNTTTQVTTLNNNSAFTTVSTGALGAGGFVDYSNANGAPINNFSFTCTTAGMPATYTILILGSNDNTVAAPARWVTIATITNATAQTATQNATGGTYTGFNWKYISFRVTAVAAGTITTTVCWKSNL